MAMITDRRPDGSVGNGFDCEFESFSETAESDFFVSAHEGKELLTPYRITN